MESGNQVTVLFAGDGVWLGNRLARGVSTEEGWFITLDIDHRMVVCHCPPEGELKDGLFIGRVFAVPFERVSSIVSDFLAPVPAVLTRGLEVDPSTIARPPAAPAPQPASPIKKTHKKPVKNEQANQRLDGAKRR